MKYVVVGDSQAEGVLLRNAMPALLGSDLVGSYDHRGWSSARLLADGAIATAAGRAAATGAKILIFSGGNDENVLDTPEAFARYRETLLDIVRVIARKSANAGVPLSVVWFGPVFALEPRNATQHPETARAMRLVLTTSDVQRAVAEVPGAQVSLRWVDSQPLTRDLARVENVHLTADNYTRYAERALSAASSSVGVFGMLFVGLAAYAGWRAWRSR